MIPDSSADAGLTRWQQVNPPTDSGVDLPFMDKSMRTPNSDNLGAVGFGRDIICSGY